MEQTPDITQLNQSGLQNLLGGQAPSLIPESLVTTLTVGFIVLNVLSVLFLIFYIVGMVRKWKVESAVLTMQKDLADIKASLASRNMNQPRDAANPSATPTPQISTPQSSSRMIARDNNGTSTQV